MKIKRNLLIILIAVTIIVISGCLYSLFHPNHLNPVVTPTPTVEITPTPMPTITPFIAPTSTPTVVPTFTPAPTPVVTAVPSTPVPVSSLPIITKSPTDEVVNEGGECYFVAKYENATIAVWHFISPDGRIDLAYQAAQEMFPTTEIIDGMYSTLHLKNISYALNGWRVYCRYSNANGSVSTRTALLSVIPAPIVTPIPTVVPTSTPIPTPVVTPEPTIEPTPEPTLVVTVEPTLEPIVLPTPIVTPEPTVEPTPIITPEPTAEPTPVITPEPTVLPTAMPTVEPTPIVTPEPMVEPTPIVTPELTPETIPSPSITDIFEVETEEYFNNILKGYEEAEEKAAQEETEYIKENYLNSYEINAEAFTVEATYNITNDFITDIREKSANTDLNMSIIEVVIKELNIKTDFENIQHFILHLVIEDEEYYTFDLITDEIIFEKIEIASQ